MVICFGNMVPFAFRFGIDVGIDKRGLLLALVVCLMTSMICGMGPAISASRTDVMQGLKGLQSAPPGRRRYAMRHWLIVPQVSLSLLLMLVAGLFIRSLQTAQSQDLGYDPAHIAFVALDMSLLLMVMSKTLKMALIGSALGLSLAVAVTRILSSYLYGITPTDSTTFTMVPLLFGSITLLGCYVPARRATRIDPMVAPRSE
jgi:ABC-type antimicrobial peptide transport system permease subunit